VPVARIRCHCTSGRRRITVAVDGVAVDGLGFGLVVVVGLGVGGVGDGLGGVGLGDGVSEEAAGAVAVGGAAVTCCVAEQAVSAYPRRAQASTRVPQRGRVTASSSPSEAAISPSEAAISPSEAAISPSEAAQETPTLP